MHRTNRLYRGICALAIFVMLFTTPLGNVNAVSLDEKDISPAVVEQGPVPLPEVLPVDPPQGPSVSPHGADANRPFSYDELRWARDHGDYPMLGSSQDPFSEEQNGDPQPLPYLPGAEAEPPAPPTDENTGTGPDLSAQILPEENPAPISIIATGTVLSADGSPLPGAHLRLESIDGDQIISVICDERGAFQTLIPVPGEYHVAVSDSQGVPKALADPNPVTMSADMGSFTIKLAPDLSVPSQLSEVPMVTAETEGEVGSISGQVVDEDSSAALSSIRITVYSSEGAYVQSVTSGETGYFSISGLIPGQYKLSAEPFCNQSDCSNLDYIWEYYNNRTQWDLADFVTVVSAQDTSGIQIALKRGGHISGTVTTEVDHTPMSNVWVYAYQADPYVHINGYTDLNGAYNLYALPDGLFQVGFSYSEYVHEYYNNQTSASTANLVSISNAQTVTGIDAALTLGGKITGTVTSADQHTAIENCSVQACLISTQQCYYAQTSADGQYTIFELPAGTYRVGFTPPYGSFYLSEYYLNQSSQELADGVVVTTGNTAAEIDAELELGGTLEGIITDQTTHAAVSPLGLVLLSPDAGVYYYATTDSNGQYRIQGIKPGNYKLQIGGYCPVSPCADGDYMVEYYNNTSDYSLAEEIIFTGSEVITRNADVKKVSKISGTITADADGSALASSSVQVYSCPSLSCQTTYTFADSEGKYSTVLPGPGTYYLLVTQPFFDEDGHSIQRNYIPEWYQEQYEASDATPIVVGDEENKVINMSLAVGGQITGLALDQQANPIRGIQVVATGVDTGVIQNGYTGSDGRYTITGLPSDQYSINFMDTGDCSMTGCREYYFETKSYDYVPSTGAIDPVPVTIGGITENIDATLTQTGNISGTITAIEGGPLESAYIDVLDANGESVAYGYTDVEGKYTVRNLPPGDYRVWFRTDGTWMSTDTQKHLSEYYNDKTSLDTADFVTVTGGATTLNINGVLSNAGEIYGTITASDTHQPLPSVRLQLYRLSSGIWYYVKSYDTGEDGQYNFFGLPPADYKLEIVTQYSSSSQTVAYAGEYYKEKETFSSADVIQLGSGQVLQGVDADLDLGGSIAGRVTASATGSPLSNISVNAYVFTSSSDYPSWKCSTLTDSAGNYVLQGLTPGEYAVSFSPGLGVDYVAESYDGKSAYQMYAATRIQVTRGNRTNSINVALEPGVHFSGRVTSAADGNGLDSFIYLSDSSGVYWGNTYSNSDGYYVSHAVPAGDYRVEFEPDRDEDDRTASHITEYYNDKQIYEDADLLHLELGSPVGGINAVLSVGGKIRGTVTAEGSGIPLSGVQVQAYTYVSGMAYQWLATSGSNGTYTINGLPSGNYYIYFRTDQASGPAVNYASEYYNDQPLSGDHDLVTVNLGETIENIDASLVLGGRITGMVTSDGAHLPLEDVWIEIHDPYTFDYLDSAVTSIAGTYTTSALRPGEYLLYFSPSIYGASADYVSEFYENQDFPENALKILVVGGDQSTANASLARGGRISGQVRAADTGVGLYDIQAKVSGVNGASSWYDPYTWTDANGNYTIRGIKPGTYHVQFDADNRNTYDGSSYISEWYNNRRNSDTAANIPVTATAPVLGINAALDVGGQITGTVTDALTGEPISSATVYVNNTTGNGSESDWTGQDGTFQIRGLPVGEYRVFYSATGYVDEEYNNAHTADEIVKVPVGLGETVANINAAMEAGGIISGKVSVSGGETSIIYEIRVYDSAWNDVASMYTDALGEYQFHLMPGTYYVGFIPYDYMSATRYIRQYYGGSTLMSGAQSITLADGQTIADVNGTLQKGGQISGIVRDPEGAGIGGVLVKIFTSSGELVDDTWTNSDGTYLTRGLPQADYRVLFEPYFGSASLGYLAEYYNDQVDASSADLVSVTDGQVTESIDATLSAASISFDSAAETVQESAGTISLSVTLSAPSTSTVTVPLRVSGNASGGIDHNLVDQTVVFAPGVTQKSIPVSIIEDTVAESSETIVATLLSPTNAIIGANGIIVHTITIQDNDQMTQPIPSPSLASILPAQGRSDLPTEITLTGTNFVDGSTIELKYSAQTVSLSTQFVSATTLITTVPAGIQVGVHDVLVRNPDGKSASLPAGYQALPAEIDDLSGKSSDLWVNPATVYAAQTHRLGLVIQRQGGTATLTDVQVRFYLGNPSAGGTLIGTGVADYVSPHSSTSSAEINWVAPTAGTYTLYAVIDPEGTYQETTETNNVVSRTITVNPVPIKVVDQTPPVVDSFTVANGVERTSSQEVKLQVRASDPQQGTDVGWVMFYEYNFSESTQQWVQAQASEWIDYVATIQYPWTLSPTPGAKYIQAWVSDKAGNVSQAPLTAFINYLPDSDSLLRGQSRYYVYRLDQGEIFHATVTPLLGDADLYVWAPDFQFRDPWSSISASSIDQVGFTALVPGMYVVQVYGYTNTRYQITFDTGSSSSVQIQAVQTSSEDVFEEKLPISEPLLEPGNTPSEKRAIADAIIPPSDTRIPLFIPIIVR